MKQNFSFLCLNKTLDNTALEAIHNNQLALKAGLAKISMDVAGNKTGKRQLQQAKSYMQSGMTICHRGPCALEKFLYTSHFQHISVLK